MPTAPNSQMISIWTPDYRKLKIFAAHGEENLKNTMTRILNFYEKYAGKSIPVEENQIPPWE